MPQQAPQALMAVGAIGVAGILAVTQAPNTLRATVGMPEQAAQTLVAVGNVRASGALFVTQAPDTLTATGGPVGVAGALTVTQAPNTLRATGNVQVRGVVTVPQPAQTLTAAGGPIVLGALTAAQPVQTIAATGTVTGVGGALTVAQVPNTLAATGTLQAGGGLTVAQAAQALVAQAGPVVRGTLAATQAAQASVSRGTLTRAQQPNTLAARGTVTVLLYPDKVPETVLPESLLALVTSEHALRDKYMQTVAITVEPWVDGTNQALAYQTLFDLDTATGLCLDFVGQWIGVTRYIEESIAVFFCFDVPLLGFDQGRWRTPYDAGAITTTRLDDEAYRTLLRARIASNFWDGTIEGAYKSWDILFAETGYRVVIEDGKVRGGNPDAGSSDIQGEDGQTNGNMHVRQLILGPPLDALTHALFTGGYLTLKSATVGVDFMKQSDGFEGKPVFAFDAGPDEPPVGFPPVVLAGFDMGGWAVPLPKKPIGAALLEARESDEQSEPEQSEPEQSELEGG